MSETREFKTESKRLLDLMINSIYTNKEIFLRELISNASDAIDKYHYLSLQDETLPRRNDYEINLKLDKDLNTITIKDNGIGMTYDELINALGTIAKSGSAEFIEKLKPMFDIELEKDAFKPKRKATFGMYLDKKWYKLTAKVDILSEHPVDGLDVSVLQNNVLGPILGINDPKTDKRIDFVGGIRGLKELEKRCHNDMKLAFSMYPTSIDELFRVADAKLLMPPKSTWFEPKLRSGLFIHRIEK